MPGTRRRILYLDFSKIASARCLLVICTRNAASEAFRGASLLGARVRSQDPELRNRSDRTHFSPADPTHSCTELWPRSSAPSKMTPSSVLFRIRVPGIIRNCNICRKQLDILRHNATGICYISSTRSYLGLPVSGSACGSTRMQVFLACVSHATRFLNTVSRA